jgi:hypothetical protein
MTEGDFLEQDIEPAIEAVEEAVMETILLTDIPFQMNMDLLMKRLHLKKGESYTAEFEALAEEATGIACPKAMGTLAFIDEKGEDYVVLGGRKLTSRILRVNLDPLHRAFPFVATCGTELAEWAHSKKEMLDRYWSEEICEQAMRLASKTLRDEIDRRYQPGRLSNMNPGSLDDWPLTEQPHLFSILGDVAQQIGVTLNSSMMIFPSKSVSGILFPADETFVSCRLCPRENCPSRKAAFVEGLYEKKYMVPNHVDRN